jgi:hypothetical protein
MTANEPVVIDAHGKHAQAVHFTRDGKLLISVGQDACIRLWSVPDFRPAGVLEGHAKSVNTIALSPEEDLLATGSTDGTVRVWSFPQGKCLHILVKQVFGTFAPDGATLGTVSAKGRVVLWDARRGVERLTLPALDKRILGLAFAPDGATLLAGGTGPIHRVSLPEGVKQGELTGHKLAVTCVRFAPGGQLAASTGADGTLRFWSAADWSEVRRVELQACGVLQFAFAPQGETVTVAADHRIQTFAVHSGEPVGRLDLPLKGLYGVAISPDGRYLANAAADGKVRVWERS